MSSESMYVGKNPFYNKQKVFKRANIKFKTTDKENVNDSNEPVFTKPGTP